jgi:hypothetical protein
VHARRRHRAGAADATIAAELGVSHETVRRWMSSARLVPVEILDARMGATEGAPRTLSVVSPSGFHVDGLTLEEAATLLRVLG